MSSLPQVESTLLIRTDFSDEEAWQALSIAVATPNDDDFLADLHVVDDPEHRDLTPDQVKAIAGENWLLVLADRTAMTSPGTPLLVLCLEDDVWEELRVVAEELCSIENNLSLANMDWEDFAGAADDDGVFRGF